MNHFENGHHSETVLSALDKKHNWSKSAEVNLWE